ncbi:MAG: GSCFA domain-containing protein [Bacteroidales bacterium]|nr:GSCFA domain-containing protein [Bacteroidales bacterium]
MLTTLDGLQLQTPVVVPRADFSLSHDDSILLVGSCFTDHMGERLQRAGFHTLTNPFGVLYNPCSIAACLTRCFEATPVTSDDLVFHDGLWHSWLHHGSFSSVDKEQCLALCNKSMTDAHDFLRSCSTVIVTLGTAYVYYLKNQDSKGRVVANCHRLPADRFVRRLLSVEECVSALLSLPLQGKRVIFTVSPIRHLADGAHGNQLSKSTLLLALEQYAQQVEATYFPAYEIVLDELRDYRFYERDMVHPSPLAIDIVWQRFQSCFFSSVTQNACHQYEKQFRQQQHRPIARN